MGFGVFTKPGEKTIWDQKIHERATGQPDRNHHGNL